MDKFPSPRKHNKKSGSIDKPKKRKKIKKSKKHKKKRSKDSKSSRSERKLAKKLEKMSKKRKSNWSKNTVDLSKMTESELGKIFIRNCAEYFPSQELNERVITLIYNSPTQFPVHKTRK